MANTDKIEREAVRAVEGYLDKCPKLKPIINSNDKTPIWDGDIYVYINDNQKTENFLARVPLQVKGTTIAEDNTFRINREYLDGFKAERGTAFFMVKEDENSSQVFYALLTSKDIDILLRQTTKTINLPLRKVPTVPLDFEEKLYAFAASRNSEKVDNTSPKEIAKLVERFEKIRKHIKEIEDKSVRAKLKTHLDTIKNLSEDTLDDDTIGWRDSFYYCSREAIDLAINNIENFDFADLQFKLGNYLVDQRQYHLAENYYSKVLKEYRKRAEANPYPWRKNDVAMTLNNLGNLHSDLNRYAEAEEEYKEALEIHRELANTNRDAFIGDVATTLNNLAGLYWNLNRLEDAVKELKEALEIRRELARTNRDAYIADVATTLNNLGNLHKDLTSYDEAEKEYKEALEIDCELAETNRDAHIADVATDLNNLAILHDDLTRYDEAEKEYKEALEIYRELAKTNRDAYIADVAMTLNNLAALHYNLTRYAEAEKEYKEALIILRELAQTNRDAYIGYVAMTLNNLAVLHKNLTRYDEAEEEYKEALEIRRELANTNRNAYIADVAQTLYNIALLQEAIDRKAEAKQTAKEALGIYKELAKAYPQIWNSRIEKTERLLKDLSE